MSSYCRQLHESMWWPLLCAVLLSQHSINADLLEVVGCQNDTSCLVAGGDRWQCKKTTTSTGGSPCHINGHQQQKPPYAWPTEQCSCVATPACSAPTHGRWDCRSHRCIPGVPKGVANSSSSCEWQTGCSGLAANEWLAAPFEFAREDNVTFRCIKAGAYLKKSEAPSAALPAAMKLGVPLNATIRVNTPPTKADDYLIFSCSSTSLCGQAKATLGNLVHDQAGPESKYNYLMIGDSISLGLLPTTTDILTQHGINTVHNVGNAGNANNLLHHLECYLRQSPGLWDFISFNAGIHGLAQGQEWLTDAFYGQFMYHISQVLKDTGARVFVVTTTPAPTNATVPSDPAVSEGLTDLQIISRNQIAINEAKKAGVVDVIDLHDVIVRHCGKNYTSCPLQDPGGVHFTDQGWSVLGTAVAGAIANSSSSY